MISFQMALLAGYSYQETSYARNLSPSALTVPLAFFIRQG